MNDLRNITAAELDQLFADVTAEAAREALQHGLAITGTDESGKIVRTESTTRIETTPQTERARLMPVPA